MNSGGSITEGITLGSVSLSVPEIAATMTFGHSSSPTLFLYGAWGASLKESPLDGLDRLLVLIFQ
jgi:hypothetical protein